MNNNTNRPTKDLESPEKFAYLLHLWRGSDQWRASLENLETGKRLGFANLEQLFSYLMDLIEDNVQKQLHPAKAPKDEPPKRN